MTMTEVDVDVLMTVYNGEAHVEEAIASLQAQTLQTFRLQVVDDGSTDGTPAILSRLASADARIQVHTKANGGVVEASNHGLTFCTAEFVARLDADDICYPDRLEHQVGYLRTHPDVLAIAGRARHVDVKGKRLGSIAKFPPVDLADPDHLPAVEPYLLHPFLTVRRSALERIGGYRQLSVSEDSDLYWRLQEHGKLHSDLHLDGDYRMNPVSLSSKSVSNGRVMAAFSQLSALSARRRRSGQGDLVFTRDLATSLQAASHSLQAICTASAAQLHASEVDRFNLAVGMKLLEMASYRPYEVERADCDFVRVWRERIFAQLTLANRNLVARNISGNAARLAAKGMWPEARALMGAQFTATFWTRYAMRTALTPTIHRHARNVLHAIKPKERRSA